MPKFLGSLQSWRLAVGSLTFQEMGRRSIHLKLPPTLIRGTDTAGSPNTSVHGRRLVLEGHKVQERL